MRCIGFYVNLHKRTAHNIAGDVYQWLVQQGKNVVLPMDQARAVELKAPGLNWDEYLREVDIVIVFGGDGTLLAATRRLAPARIPVMGVNLGHLGFLTAVEPHNVLNALAEVFAGKYHIDHRMMLASDVYRKGTRIYNYLALNEIVVTKGAFARLIRLQTHINGEYFATYPGDGLIVATPTGSTAYSLSAGGPIINPELHNLIITPICPHTLSSRSLLIPEKEKVKVVVKADHQDLMLTFDGQQGYPLTPEDEIVIYSAPFRAKLVRLTGKSFYQVLRTRLNEGAFAEGFGPMERL